MTDVASNGARFALVPLTMAGTSTQTWLSAKTLPPLDLGACQRLIILSAHPDDETLGLGAAAAQMAASGVTVQVVAVSDGGAADPTAQPADKLTLEALRRAELRAACRTLGVSVPIFLGYPDGELADHEASLVDRFTRLLGFWGPSTWCATTWRGDGHPDHEAVGRAAAAAAARTGVTLLEYPIWMWHWATPKDSDVPWAQAFSVPAPRWASAVKHAAVQCFQSQTSKPDIADQPPVLPGFVLDRLLALPEVVFCGNGAAS